MTNVAKYNTFKGLSTGLTFGTPLVTMLCVGDVILTQPSSTISASAVFALIVAALFCKDKIAENFKMPSALMIAVAAFVFCILVENILYPMKIISLTTIAACLVDEVSFKRLYKLAELQLPKGAAAAKHFGFYLGKQSTIDSLTEATHEEA